MSETKIVAAEVKLAKPVQAHGEPVDTLRFREPTGADIAKVGFPMSFGADGSATFDGPKMSAMMAALADVPPSTIKALSARDWVACAAVLGPFFGD